MLPTLGLRRFDTLGPALTASTVQDNLDVGDVAEFPLKRLEEFRLPTPDDDDMLASGFRATMTPPTRTCPFRRRRMSCSRKGNGNVVRAARGTRARPDPNQG